MMDTDSKTGSWLIWYMKDHRSVDKSNEMLNSDINRNWSWGHSVAPKPMATFYLSCPGDRNIWCVNVYAIMNSVMMTLVVNTLQQLVQRVVRCIRTFISGSKFPASAYLCGRPPTTLADRCVIRLLIVCTTILPHQQLSVCPAFPPSFPSPGTDF